MKKLLFIALFIIATISCDKDDDNNTSIVGKWTGIHSESGKSWELISYHTWDFKDGLIISGGDYFDAGGLLSSLASNESTE